MIAAMDLLLNNPAANPCTLRGNDWENSIFFGLAIAAVHSTCIPDQKKPLFNLVLGYSDTLLPCGSLLALLALNLLWAILMDICHPVPLASLSRIVILLLCSVLFSNDYHLISS